MSDKDAIYRQDAIDALDEIESEVEDGDGFQYEKWREYFAELPPAQPEPIWGLPVSADRPLADVEIVSRLRDIQKQISGGSYAIDRAIEIIEAVAERRTDEID